MISEHQLSGLVGSWKGPEELFATPWTPAGKADGALVITPAPQNGLLIGYEERRDGEIAMTGHGIVIGSGWWWFDSYGYAAERPGAARWDGGALELERHSDRGRTVMRFALNGGALLQQIMTAVPADADLQPMLSGTYERI
jgi:hypothetical protein